jgi:hypothetical protein
MTQSEEIMFQVDIKDKEGVVHGFWTVQCTKDVLDSGKKLHQEATRERRSGGGPGTP